MNTEQVARFIAYPAEMDASVLPVLKELADKHPYSSVYSLLYISAVSRFQSIALDQAIEEHAYRLSDRKRLYHIAIGIQNEQKEADSIEEIKEIQEKAIQVEELSFTKNIETPVKTHELETENEVEIQQEILQIEEIEQTETEGISDTLLHEDARAEINDDFQFDLETTAFSKEQAYFVDNLEVIDLISDEIETVKETEIPVVQIEIEKIPTEEKEIRTIETVQNGPKSFTSWLKAGSGNVEKEVETPLSNPKQAIIDKFIAEQPKISRAKTEFYSPSRKAKESLNEESIPVSETLAKIFAAQGNYPKAIHVYHQLILSIPEKKSLFALQIEELKKKITP